MAIRQVIDGLWQIDLGAVNAYLIADGTEVTLIDTGVPGSAAAITSALGEIGRQPGDVRHVVVTHCHPDHSGSLAAIKRLTGAPAYMHPLDAAMVRTGEGKRPMRAAPGILRPVMYRFFVAGHSGRIDPADVEHEVIGGVELPIAGGLQAIHAPGHCAGQIVLLWPRRGLLFAADAASNLPTFGLSLGYEDLETGRASLSQIATLDFEIACFGHGRPLMRKAAAAFRAKWSAHGAAPAP